MICKRCSGTGFLNIDQVPNSGNLNIEEILKWIEDNENHDVQICDCCGDGYGWYGEPGGHYSSEDPPGKIGVYAYNGGYAECH